MNVSELISQFGLYAATLIICTVARAFPLLNTEVYLLSISTLLPKSLGELLAIVLLATLGQMLGKSLMFFATQGAIQFSLKQHTSTRLKKLSKKWKKWATTATGLFFFPVG